MIYLLNAQDQLVGCTSYCDIAKKDNKPIVASAIEVNVESVIVQKPDMVIATSITKPSTIEAIKKVGIKVLVLSTPKTFHEICTQLIEVGKMAGKEKIARDIVNKQEQRLTLLQQKIPKGEHPKVFMQIGAKPIFTVLSNTFMDDFITYSGGQNIASDLTHGTMTRESVLLRNPDVIIIATMGITSEDEKKSWAAYGNINAIKKGKVFMIDSSQSCGPTPVDFADLIEVLIKQIYN